LHAPYSAGQLGTARAAFASNMINPGRIKHEVSF
jgi:hypothetical protein